MTQDGAAPDLPPAEPDTKDWTWVLDRACPECGFLAASVDPPDVGPAMRDLAVRFRSALARPDARERPTPTTWSALEYACHVRDVHRIFGERVALILAEEDPLFANWDQDETAVVDRYHAQDPATVAAELVRAAEATATAFDGVRVDQWERSGRRSNGSVFTVRTLGRYYLHDVVHHAHDIGA